MSRRSRDGGVEETTDPLRSNERIASPSLKGTQAALALNPKEASECLILDPVDMSRHDKMVLLVERMLGLHKELAAAKTVHEKTALQRQIDATDNQIDHLVYELYALTEEEIKIVEEAQ